MLIESLSHSVIEFIEFIEFNQSEQSKESKESIINEKIKIM